MGPLSVWNGRQSVTPRPILARMGALVFALVVVIVAIWLLSRLQ